MISNIGSVDCKRRVRFMVESKGPANILIEAYLTVKLLTGGLSSVDVTSLVAAEKLDPEIAGVAAGIMQIEGVDCITIKEASIEIITYPAFNYEKDGLMEKIAQVIKDEVFGGKKIEIDYFPMSLKPSILKKEL